MTRIRLLLHCALAVIAAMAFCSRSRLSANDGGGPVAGVARIGQVDVIPDSGFDAGTGLYQGIVFAGANPPTYGPPPTWPCFSGVGSAPCSGIPAGGLVIPFPAQVLPVKSMGEIGWTFTTTTATGSAAVSVKVTQGSTTLFSNSANFPVSANGIWCAYVGNAKLSGAKTGTATVTVTTTVGTVTITGKTVLHIQ